MTDEKFEERKIDSDPKETTPFRGLLSEHTEVLIVGAGPTGLTLACELGRRGISYEIIDSSVNPFNGSRGKGLQPRTLEVFDDLGIIEAIIAAGQHYPRFRTHIGCLSVRGGGVAPVVEATSEIPYPNLWMIPQWRTEQILRKRMAEWGGEVKQNTELIAFKQDPSGVTATLRCPTGERLLRSSFLVGCDGGHSFVRKSLGLLFIGEAVEGPRILVADVEIDGLDQIDWHAWPFARGCIFTLCPLPGTNQHQLQAPLSKRIAAPDLTEEALRLFMNRAIGSQHFQMKHASWISIYQAQARMVDRYRVGRVFLAGDAAHVHPPSGGQGLNTGIQDAYNLGWKLAHVLQGASSTLLDTYETERLPIAASVLGLSGRLFKQFSVKRGPETHQLTLNYRDSPLSLDTRNIVARLQAGDRAPDSRCKDDKGQEKRLFDVFRGTHITLLLFGNHPVNIMTEAAARWDTELLVIRLVKNDVVHSSSELADPGARAHQSYGMLAGGALLVRPDGYIGLISTVLSINQLKQYLEETIRIRPRGLGSNSGPVNQV